MIYNNNPATPMTNPDIHFEQQGAVAIVRLNRPSKRNAISDLSLIHI